MPKQCQFFLVLHGNCSEIGFISQICQTSHPLFIQTIVTFSSRYIAQNWSNMYAEVLIWCRKRPKNLFLFFYYFNILLLGWENVGWSSSFLQNSILSFWVLSHWQSVWSFYPAYCSMLSRSCFEVLGFLRGELWTYKHPSKAVSGSCLSRYQGKQSRSRSLQWSGGGGTDLEAAVTLLKARYSLQLIKQDPTKHDHWRRRDCLRSPQSWLVLLNRTRWTMDMTGSESAVLCSIPRPCGSHGSTSNSTPVEWRTDCLHGKCQLYGVCTDIVKTTESNTCSVLRKMSDAIKAVLLNDVDRPISSNPWHKT